MNEIIFENLCGEVKRLRMINEGSSWYIHIPNLKKKTHNEEQVTEESVCYSINLQLFYIPLPHKVDIDR